jgi:hypothetical protein
MNYLPQEATEAAITKVALTVQNAGAAVAVGSGTANAFNQVLGLTPSQWTVVGIIGGLVVGAIGMLANVAINAWFKHQQLKLLARGRKEE